MAFTMRPTLRVVSDPPRRLIRSVVEDRRRDRNVAGVSAIIGDGADVVVHAEDFLDHDDRAFWRARRISAVGAKLLVVGCRERYVLSHRRSLLV